MIPPLYPPAAARVNGQSAGRVHFLEGIGKSSANATASALRLPARPRRPRAFCPARPRRPSARFLSRACPRAPASPLRLPPRGFCGGNPTQGGCTTCLRRSFLDGWREWSINSCPRKIRILKKADFSDIIDLTEYLPGAKCPADRKFRKKRRGSAKGDVFGRQSIHFQFERNKGE